MTMRKLLTKNLAWVAVIATLLMVVLSISFVAENLEHDCTGEDCSVCAIMAECESEIRSLGGAILLSFAVAYAIKRLTEKIYDDTETLVASSLISQKVRLNN